MEVLVAAAALGAGRAGLVRKGELVQQVGRGRVARALAAGLLHEVATGVVARSPLPAQRRFVVTPTGPDPAYLLRTAATLLSLGPDVSARARTAAVLLGAELLVEPDQVEVLVRRGRVPAPRVGVDVRVGRRRPATGEAAWPGLPRMRTTRYFETVEAIAGERGKREAVAVLDCLLRRGYVTEQEVAAAAERGALATPAGRSAAAACDRRAGSVLESAARVALLDAGLGGFTTQHVLRDRGGVKIGAVDFAWEPERVLLEVDGERYHGETRADRLRDRRRDNGAARQHWLVLRATWDEVVSGEFLAAVADTLGRPCPRALHVPGAA